VKIGVTLTWDKRDGSNLVLAHLKAIIEKKVQGQIPGSEWIWVLFLANQNKKLKYKTIILYIFWK
jgi:hypothetical protein